MTLGWSLIVTIGGRGSDGLCITWALFGESYYEHYLEFSWIVTEYVGGGCYNRWRDKMIDDCNKVTIIILWITWAVDSYIFPWGIKIFNA